MHLRHRPDRAALHQFHHAAVVSHRMNLRPHLRRHLRLPRRLADHARLPDIVGQRFLTIHMLPRLERRQRCQRMRVLRSAHDHRIVILQFRKELPEIHELLRAGKFRHRRREVLLIHIAQRDDVIPLRRHVRQISRPAPAAADHCDIQLPVQILPSHDGGESQRRRRQRRRAEELTAGGSGCGMKDAHARSLPAAPAAWQSGRSSASLRAYSTHWRKASIASYSAMPSAS